MQIEVNGEKRDIPEDMTVEALMLHLGLPADRLAVERNREVVSRTQWSNTFLQPGDQLEVIHLVGGGEKRCGGFN